jgi:hypothetical protein
MSARIADLVAGFAFAGAFLLLAWIAAIGPEDRNPSRNGFYAQMRSRSGRRTVAAIIAVMAIGILILHIVKFLAEKR